MMNAFRYAITTWIISLPLGATGQMLNDGKGLFSYDPQADNGPPRWYLLDTSPDANVCGQNKQSPIPLSMSAECSSYGAKYTFNSGDCTYGSLDYFTNDHSAEAKYPQDGSCTPGTMSLPDVDGTYKIEQFHIHLGSEHTLEGNEADFELHGVHKLESGTGGHKEFPELKNSQAVLGIWIQPGDDTPDNAKFQALIDGWKAFHNNILNSDACASKKRRKALEISAAQLLRSLADTDVFDVYSLIPESTTGYAFYDGSLTTPPCTEDLWWTVSNRALKISKAQGDELRQLILDYRNAETCEHATGASPLDDTTSRDPQDLNGRTTIFYCTGEDPDGEGAPSSATFTATGTVVWGVMVIMTFLSIIV